MNEDFTYAVRVLLTVAYNQSNSRLTSIGELISCGHDKASAMVSVIDKLIFAEILIANGPAYRLARSPSSIKLHEVYAVTIPVSRLPRTPFERLYESLVEEAKVAVSREYEGWNLSDSLAELLSRTQDWPSAASDR
jgi:DNA-binding IscR family transcriptional regulator